MEESGQAYSKGPGVVVHPVLLLFLTLIGGLILQFFFPIRFINDVPVQLGIGVPIIGVGLGLRRWVFRIASTAKTSLNPHSAVRSLVVDGPFRFSRNPLYLSGIVTLLGVMVAVDTLWLLILQTLALVPIFLQVRREEEYLDARFGEEYKKYKARVRRWL